MNIALFYHRIFIEVLTAQAADKIGECRFGLYIMYPPCESEKNHNIKEEKNKQLRLKTNETHQTEEIPLAIPEEGLPCGVPTAALSFSLLEVITI